MGSPANEERSAAGMKTAACEQGEHGICRCEKPGQNRRYAGLVVEFDKRTETLYPVAFCVCECHDGERRAG